MPFPPDQPRLRDSLDVVRALGELPMERIAVDEGGAYGPALLAGVGAGAFASVEEAAVLARPTATIEPAWDVSEPLARYRALYPALRGAG